MNSLILINESFTNGYKAEFIYIISLASVLSGIFVIISKNPIVSVLFLIGLFLSIACYLLVLGINFIGLSYLLLYVGAVSILFLFILMLINVRISELLNDTSNSLPLALVIAISFNYPVYQILPINLLNIHGHSVNLDNNITDYLKSYIGDFTVKNYSSDYVSRFFNFFFFDDDILFVTSNFWDGSLAETTHITSIGNIMYTSYSIWLIITSIILLLAMVGAIVITIKQKD
uniref:NADH dehydrogenase subunit 6 n=1 Tax=Stereocaulon pileatum TaxID=209148 RepID=UPI0022FDA6B6|nr:NADH dehydrogenase subunit 6 [Stereocaulon pileatum]WBP63162.1 NADH dehydrogenase subunit 6 [Stereocaulon pileatum]